MRKDKGLISTTSASLDIKFFSDPMDGSVNTPASRHARQAAATATREEAKTNPTDCGIFKYVCER